MMRVGGTLYCRHHGPAGLEVLHASTISEIIEQGLDAAYEKEKQ